MGVRPLLVEERHNLPERAGTTLVGGRVSTPGIAAMEPDPAPDGAVLAAEEGGVTNESMVEPAAGVSPSTGTSNISVSTAEPNENP